MTARHALVVVVLAACSDSPDSPDAADCVRAFDTGQLAAMIERTIAELAASPRASEGERDAARAGLSARLDELGLAPELHAYPGGANVIATLDATLPTDDSIVVGAHFDSAAGSPGASDNASGAAVVLATAGVLRDASCRHAAVTFAFFDQEEIGLRGSRAFAATLDPARVRAVYTIDQVSWDADGDRGFELELPTPAIENTWRVAAGAVGVTLTTTATTGTDHQAFREMGFAAAGLTEEYVGGDTSPHIHTAGDTPASVAPYTAYAALAAELAATALVDELAR